MFERGIVALLRTRLREPRHTMQALLGPRQVGKTTAVRQTLDQLELRSIYASADAPELQARTWIYDQWNQARAIHTETRLPVVLVLDEVPKLPRWTDVVKQLWDEDTWHGRDIRVVLLCSAPLHVGRGLRESMAGRYEIIHASHWSWPECRDAFGWSLDQYIYFGGYPGGVEYVGDEDRWREYVKETAIETTVSRDLLNQSRV
ncbi:MAG: AAA family ATPase, partial [Actinomycetota bacterium]|nr:AAA family ATPase [Actinomycetota bacterium]